MGFSCCPDWEFVEPQSFSFSRKRAHCCTITQEEMRYGSTQVKAPPLSRRRMRPPTPLQNSNSSSGEEQGRCEVEDQMWSARERTIIARTKQYLEERIAQRWILETLLGSEDFVDFRRVPERSKRRKKGARYLRPSAPMVRVTSWSGVRDGTSTKGSGTHFGDKIRKRAWKSRELDGARWDPKNGPLPKQSSWEEEGLWVAMEDRRR